MKKHIAVLSVALVFFFFAVCQNVRAEDPAKDARAAYAKFVKAAKAKNTAEAKKYITKDFLKEMEKEGVLDTVLEIEADQKPNAAKAEVKENIVILTVESTHSVFTKRHMVKENGQWKVGEAEGKK